MKSLIRWHSFQIHWIINFFDHSHTLSNKKRNLWFLRTPNKILLSRLKRIFCFQWFDRRSQQSNDSAVSFVVYIDRHTRTKETVISLWECECVQTRRTFSKSIHCLCLCHSQMPIDAYNESKRYRLIVESFCQINVNKKCASVLTTIFCLVFV